jgi:dethiobiotin synthetase
MLSRATIPGLFVTGTDTGVGKTLVAAGIAGYFRRRNLRVAVCKPVATGCVHRREGLVSEDAEFLAHHARSPFPLDVICPQRYAEPLAPAIAAERANQPLDWNAIDSALRAMSRQADVMIVEGVGGIRVPLDSKSTVLEKAQWLGLPTVIVARPSLGTINHTLLTLDALRNAKVDIAGVVINDYPPETPGIAEETNPRAIERWGRTNILCMTPKFTGQADPELPEDFLAAIESVDWLAKLIKADGSLSTRKDSPYKSP